MDGVVYVLYSASCDKFYIGSCRDLEERMSQHLNKTFGQSFTGIANDWSIFWKMDELGYNQCRSIEQHIKRMKSRKYLHDLKAYPEISEKLRSKYD